MKALITGTVGFIGSTVASREESHQDVVILDDFVTGTHQLFDKDHIDQDDNHTVQVCDVVAHMNRDLIPAVTALRVLV